MNKAHAIGAKMTVTMNGKTEEWTKLDRETWNTAGGSEGMAWVSWERPDMVRDLKEAARNVAGLERKAARGDEDAADMLIGAREELAEAQENLSLMHQFFPELAR